MKLQRSGLINAPIEHVYACLTDIKYIKNELRRYASGEDIKVHYDRKKPFATGKEITFIREEPILSFVVEENNPPTNLKILFKLKNKYSEKIGNFYYQATLENQNGKTKYMQVYTSEKEPTGSYKKYSWFFLLVAKFLIWSENRRFIKHVKSTNV